MVFIYPIFAVVAFFAATYVMWKRARELHFEEKDFFDLVFMAMFWMLIGSRIGYVLVHLPHYWHNTQLWGVLFRPAWLLPAGLLVMYQVVLHEAKKLRWDGYLCLDIMVTGFFLAQAIITLGLFVNDLVMAQVLHLYSKNIWVGLGEFFGYSVGFVYLWWVEGVYRTFPWYRGNKSQAASGYLFSMYLIWWGIVSLIASLFRTPSLVYGRIQFDTVIPVIVILIGVLVLGYRANGSWKSMWWAILDYFGLAKKAPYTRKRNEIEKIFD